MIITNTNIKHEFFSGKLLVHILTAWTLLDLTGMIWWLFGEI